MKYIVFLLIFISCKGDVTKSKPAVYSEGIKLEPPKGYKIVKTENIPAEMPNGGNTIKIYLEKDSTP